jgi:hypothetical protein
MQMAKQLKERQNTQADQPMPLSGGGNMQYFANKLVNQSVWVNNNSASLTN